MRYTVDEVITAVKRNAAIPTSQKKFSNSDFLAFMNEELQLTLVGELISQKEDYFIVTSNTALAANTSEYDIPPTAIGWKLDAVGYVNDAGDYTPLAKVTRSQRGMYQRLLDSSAPTAYYVQGNKVILVPNAGATVDGSLQFDYVRLQSELVLTASCGLISSVSTSGDNYLIDVNQVPNLASGIDVISGTNPFNLIAEAASATSGATTITAAQSDFERAPVIGDFVAATGQTCIPFIPEDYHPALAQAVAIRCLASSNDAGAIRTQMAVLQNMFNVIRNRSKIRVNAGPQKIVSRSRIINLMRGR